jgi:hypothetical protein
MTKLMDAAGAPDAKDIFAERQETAMKFIGAQERAESWKMLPGSKPVTLAEIRGGACRWPIGNPRDLETFRFCGSVCTSSGSYCEAHTTMAISPSRPRMSSQAKDLAAFKKVA